MNNASLYLLRLVPLTGERVVPYFILLVNTAAILSNCLLLYVIWRHTPKRMHTFSVLLINTTICDLVIAVCAFLTNNRVIPSGDSVIFISHGPCSYFGYKTCEVLHKVMMHALIHCLMSQVLSFSYRYYILVRPQTPTSSQLARLCLLTYLPTFIWLVVNLQDFASPLILRLNLQQYHPTYDVEGLTLFGNINYQETIKLMGLLYVILPNIPIYILIVILKRKIVKILDNKRLRLHQTNRTVHLQLLSVLCLQSYLPLLLILTMTLYALGQLQILNHPILEYLTMATADILPLASSLITMRYITPYRRAVGAIFALRNTLFDQYYKHHPFTESKEHHSPRLVSTEPEQV